MAGHRKVLIDRFEGKGAVSLDGVVVAKVRYNIMLEQERVDAGHGDEVAGYEETRGSITLVEGLIDVLAAGKLRLHLSNGSRLPILLKNPDPMATLFYVHGNGEFEAAE